MDNNNKEKKDIVFAFFLIFTGGMFLLNTTGLLGWGIWEYIINFWPIFLIIGGIKLISGDSTISKIITGTISVLLFLGVFILSYLSYTNINISFMPKGIIPNLNNTSVQEEASISSSAYNNIDKRKLKIDIGASEFTLTDGSELDNYININSQYVKNYIEPQIDSNQDNSTLNIFFNTQSPRNIFFWGRKETVFNLVTGLDNINTDIDITLGAGKGSVDLDTLSTESISCDVGAGRLDMTINNSSIPSKLDINIGAGEFNLSIPKDTGFRITYDLGVGEISFDNEDIASSIGKEGVYESENISQFENILEITADVGVGSLNIDSI